MHKAQKDCNLNPPHGLQLEDTSALVTGQFQISIRRGWLVGHETGKVAGTLVKDGVVWLRLYA